jgi:RNA polymerase sigma factor (sigma-70 family)
MGERRSDAEVMSEARSDPEAFGSIFERHFDAVHAYLVRRVGRIGDDLTAQTFVKAFEARASYDLSHSSARPWLFGIATNLLRRHWRTERRELRAFARLGRDPLRDEFELANERLDALAAGPILARALLALSPGDREALLLFAWAEQSYSDIAQALDIPIGTVRSRLSRARARMRELLEANGQLLDVEAHRR